MCIEDRYCAFIDILGFKNKLKNFEEGLQYYRSYFGAYHSLEKMHDQLIESIRTSLSEDKDVGPLVQSYCFSDSIIISSSDWKALFFKICHVMSYMLEFGFLFRGGIGYGKYFSNITSQDIQIVSEGLVQAYEVESNVAKYPRIVLHESALNTILDSVSSIWDLDHMLIQSEDNLWFINPFFLNPDIRGIHNLVKRNLEKYRGQKFVDKYYWMNELCQYFISQEYIREDPQLYFEGKLKDETTEFANKYFFFTHIYIKNLYMEISIIP